MIRSFPGLWRSPIAVLSVVAGLFSSLVLLGQMVPDAPIQHFRLPMFGENGYKSWELRGLKGSYLSDSEALVEGLELVVFSGDEFVFEETSIRSPKATIYLKEARAEGDSSLFVLGPGYEIQGRNWTWEGSKRKITVRESVRVSFSGTVDILD
ncbi:hypothetical protein G0Q06_12360 [Puniceicoccales bacterium CK1056]|uniref:LPS export ABC transporter periplasmic protein LptC n=1 Tax=Oceanipulchritudo coccoides TaxID=2706888 RepID=A0A6B2M6F3_9BACT|nr:hypothetical protein [Oceanipulchritudo coccoides]NDV63250.1 hypothetical protein [Oceanipulchritudo coccoides]